MDGKINISGGFSSGSDSQRFQTLRVKQSKRESALASESRSSGDEAAVQVSVSKTARIKERVEGLDRAVSRVQGGQALEQLQQLAERKRTPVEAVPSVDTAALEAESEARTYKGTYRDGYALFDAVALKVSDDGEVEGTLYLPDGNTLQGSGSRDADGTLRIEFEDGNRYEGNLEIKGSSATITDLKYLGNAVPAAEPEAVESPEFYGVARDGVVAFDGMLMKLDGNGGVEMDVFAGPDQRMRGEGTLDASGNLNVRLENGDVYKAKLAVSGESARLSDVEFVGGEREG